MPSSATREHALALAKLGWPLFPVNGKRPTIKDWPNRATTDPTQVAEWWPDGTRLGIGVVCGPRSGIWVTDEDRLGALDPLDLPATTTSLTPRPGRHMFWAWDPSRPVRNGKLMDEVDIRGEGGFVVLPPSRSASPGSKRTHYEWHISPAELVPQPAPAELLDLATHGRTAEQEDDRRPSSMTPYGRAALDQEAQKVARAPEGERNEQLNRTAFSIGQLTAGGHVCEIEARERLSAAALDAGLHAPEIDKTLDSGIRAGIEKPRGPAPRGQPTAADREVLPVDDLDLRLLSLQVWEALAAHNEPPHLFRYGGIVSRIERGEDHAVVLRHLNRHRLSHAVARACVFTKETQRRTKIVAPPRDLIEDMLADPKPPLPAVTQVVHAPLFAADGRLRTEPGYDEATLSYLDLAAGLHVPPVPEKPTREEIERARSLILDDLLGDFPFSSDSDRAHAVAAGLHPFVRRLFDGPSPLHLIDKPEPGTGGTLLADVLLHPALGRPPPKMTEGRDEDEWRKRMTAKLLSAPSAVVLDNLRSRLDSAQVASAITSNIWEDRILGLSEMRQLPVRCVWMATGNNVALSDELARRSVRLLIDAKMSRPWLRNGFKHELPAWGYQHRGELIWAYLVMARAWIAAGRPGPSEAPPMGMFEGWRHTIGGILDVAGITGFLGNLRSLHEEPDAERRAWTEFLELWWAHYEGQRVGVQKLFPLAEIAGVTLNGNTDHGRKTSLGSVLTDASDRAYGQWRVEACGTKRRAGQWKMVNLDRGSPQVHAEVHTPQGDGTQGLPMDSDPAVNLCEPSAAPTRDARAHMREVGPREVHPGSQVHPAGNGQPPPPPDPAPCNACRGTVFWQGASGKRVCRVCHPPAPGAEVAP